MNEQIAQTIIDVCVFLEYSPQEIVDPDAAVGLFEQIASTLQLAEPAVQMSLRGQFRSLSNNYSGEKVTFVEELADGLGLSGGN